MLKIRQALALQIIAFGIGIILLFTAVRMFPVLDWIGAAEKWMIDQGWVGLLLYPLAYALCNLLLLPGGVLALGAGYFFGVWKGFVVILMGNLIGAAGAFIISRTIGRNRIRGWFSHSPRFVALDQAVAREGWRMVFLSMLHPLFPTSLIKYLFGLTPLPLWTTLFWVGLGQSGGIFLYVYAGSLGQEGINLWRGVTQPTVQDYVIWGAGFLLTLGILYGLGRVAIRVFKEVEAAGKTETLSEG